MFFVSCIVTFFDRTKPASSIEKPAAIQNTRNPPTKNSKLFKIKTESVGTKAGASCAIDCDAIVASRPLTPSILKIDFFIEDLPLLNCVGAGFTGAHTNSLLNIKDEDFSVTDFSRMRRRFYRLNNLVCH